MVAPGRNLPITRSQAETDWCSSSPVPSIRGSCCKGSQISGGSARKVSPKKPRDANDRERAAVDGKTGTDDAGRSAIGSAPGLVAQHGHWRSRRPVILWREKPAQERTNAEGGEVVAGHIFARKRPPEALRIHAPHAELGREG